MNVEPVTLERARELRGKMSLPEVLLWRAVRCGRLGVRFRRQHPVGDYILDFFCDEAKLAVEVDGGSHSMGDRAAKDIRRDAWLGRHGIRVIRIPARTVLQDIEVALTTVRQALPSQ